MHDIPQATRPRFLTLKHVIELTTLGKTTIYAQIKAGKLRSIKMGKRTMFLEADVAGFINALANAGQAG